MNELSAMMRQAYKEDAEQNENSNQYTSSYYNIHLRSHTDNSMSHIQHSNQISLDIQSHSLTHRSECEQIRNNMSELQEQISQEINQDAK